VKDLVIFGAGDIARLADFYFTRDARRRVVAFTVDRSHLSGDSLLDRPLVAFEELGERYPPAEFDLFVALSYRSLNRLREAKYHAARARGYALASYVSTRCSYLSETPPGDNAFILEDNTVQPFVAIGSDVTLWSGNHIGHDSVVSDHCFISSHVVVSGHVKIGPRCFLGVNATLRNGITLAPDTVVGAGACLMKSTVDKGVYMGPRAELFKKKSDEIEL